MDSNRAPSRHLPTATWSARQNLRYNEVNSGYPVIFPDGFTTDAVGNIADDRTINAMVYQDPQLSALFPT